MSHAVFEKLDQALRAIDRPGSFCVDGSARAVLPGLEVAEMGPIGLPLSEKQANELKKHSEQAPYGKGEETLIDTNVRRVWRLTSDRFALTNPDWETFLQKVVKKVQKELGLERQKLQSHLYDLLLYEPGSFFLPHRDGEKLDRMVATLVVVLPSSFQGGELVIRHEGQERVIDFGGGDSPFRIHYAAFYADCEHEVRPLRDGHRLCLVYNLTLARSKKRITAPRSAEPIERLRQILEEWAKKDEPRKLVVTLEHQYTQDGLTWDKLKGVDRAQARALVDAARQADCRAYLAVLTFHESGSAEYTGGYRRRRRWDDEENEPSNYEMEEVIESSLMADHFLDGEGNPLPILELPVEEDELLDSEAIKDTTPEEEFEGYTGNAGMTLDRWYRHAAILLWPKRRHFDVLCEGGSHAVTPVLSELVKRWQRAGAKETPVLREEALALAAAIIRNWSGHAYAGFPSGKAENCPLFASLAALDDPELIDAYLESILVTDAGADPGESLATVCQKHGWNTFQRSLQAVFKATTSATLERNVRLLEHLCLAPRRNQSGWAELCSTLARPTVAAVEKIDQETKEIDWRAARIKRGEVLAGLTRSLIAAEQEKLLSRLVDHALSKPDKYPLISTHLEALTALQPWLKKNLKRPSPGLSRWLTACREQLEALTAQEPQPPADFRRDAPIACKCADCAELKRYLEDARESEHRFRAVEHRRGHLEHQIRGHHCDLDLRTERKGSPHTLVCTKNTASYKARLNKFHQDQIHLKTLQVIEASVPS
ncbi:MAG TPA: 2OG-Fe(II) oxygenase [Gemmataceae bacterium]|nr:2OG-Fe(II) oxygenase [Gemmataceae bacterium]